MNNKTILKKAIEKAIKNGYKPDGLLGAVLRGEIGVGLDPNIYAHLAREREYYEHIFFRDFAKAFWKKDSKEWYEIDWKYHLSEMVKEKEPLKYIEKFL